MSYQIGKVYVWMSDKPALLYLKGTECTVVSGPELNVHKGRAYLRWPTDSIGPAECPYEIIVCALAGELRPKEPPSGEQSVMDQFKTPVRELEPA